MKISKKSTQPKTARTAIENRPIQRALISVYDKTGLEPLAQFLKQHKVEILSTGGTAKALKQYGLSVIDVSDYTGSPEIMDGRVKTLHPKVHGGLLGRLDDDEHLQAMNDHHILPIDLVIVNLYPFEETVAGGGTYDEIIEKIDIGGPSMVRSAAKNHAFVTVVTSPADYTKLTEEMTANNGATTLAFRTTMAGRAFARTASYDAAIGQWFAQERKDFFPETLTIAATLKQSLRYGENPHQAAAFYTLNGCKTGIAAAQQTQGKELSYNNINDCDAALQLVQEFQEPAVAIIKHANPCGVAIGNSLLDAYKKALESDPVSAFGGIVAVNKTIDKTLAETLAGMFLEAIIAPELDQSATEILQTKKNLRILVTGHKEFLPRSSAKGNISDYMVRSVGGGLLLQDFDRDMVELKDLEIVTKRQPTHAELKELLFAFKVCKHIKSNAIVLVRNNMTIGIGAGQMSRVDSVRIAVTKAADCKENPGRAQGSALASDAFFPFPDGLILAAKAGVRTVIHPGGSIRDNEVIAAADEHDIAMVITKQRHFRH